MLEPDSREALTLDLIHDLALAEEHDDEDGDPDGPTELMWWLADVIEAEHAERGSAA